MVLHIKFNSKNFPISLLLINKGVFMFIFKFFCPSCKRCVDEGCLSCVLFCDMLFDRYQSLGLALEHLKDVFDDCDDVDPIKTKVRLNMASAFDTALDCFDDSIFMDLKSFDHDYDRGSLPDQFSVDFFD